MKVEDALMTVEVPVVTVSPVERVAEESASSKEELIDDPGWEVDEVSAEA